jgi:hypothetical protein
MVTGQDPVKSGGLIVSNVAIHDKLVNILKKTGKN